MLPNASCFPVPACLPSLCLLAVCSEQCPGTMGQCASVATNCDLSIFLFLQCVYLYIYKFIFIKGRVIESEICLPSVCLLPKWL